MHGWKVYGMSANKQVISQYNSVEKCSDKQVCVEETH